MNSYGVEFLVKSQTQYTIIMLSIPDFHRPTQPVHQQSHRDISLGAAGRRSGGPPTGSKVSDLLVHTHILSLNNLQDSMILSNVLFPYTRNKTIKKIALFFSFSPTLTWRDVQYITLLTSNPDPMEDGNWISNGKNRKGKLNERLLIFMIHTFCNGPETEYNYEELNEIRFK